MVVWICDKSDLKGEKMDECGRATRTSESSRPAVRQRLRTLIDAV